MSDKVTITIQVFINGEHVSEEEAARRIIEILRRYKRNHGGRDPIGR